jgi:Tfp pilus assembly protein PilF
LGGGAKIFRLEGRAVMRAIIPLLFFCLLPGGSWAASRSERETGFGIEVAKKGLWAEARFRFEKALELDPENAAALNDLAVTLEQQGDFTRAREAYDKALKLRPNDAYIQQNFDLFKGADAKRSRKAKKKP